MPDKYRTTISQYAKKELSLYVISTLVELLIHTVAEHLEHNKRIVVPRLGTFIVKPDGKTIVFSELLRSDDGVLHGLLAAKGLGELEIDGMIDRMIFNIRHAVSDGKEYIINGFGTFAAGGNGTIRFTQAKHKSIVQGYIKPAIPLTENAGRRQAKSPITAARGKTDDKAADKTDEQAVKMSRSQIANPDPYLRGLKYDKHKKSEREGTVYVMSGAKPSRRHNMLIVLIAAIAVIGVVSYIFVRFHNNPPQQEVISHDDMPAYAADSLDMAAEITTAEEADPALSEQVSEQADTTAPLSTESN